MILLIKQSKRRWRPAGQSSSGYRSSAGDCKDTRRRHFIGWPLLVRVRKVPRVVALAPVRPGTRSKRDDRRDSWLVRGNTLYTAAI